MYDHHEIDALLVKARELGLPLGEDSRLVGLTLAELDYVVNVIKLVGVLAKRISNRLLSRPGFLEYTTHILCYNGNMTTSNKYFLAGIGSVVLGLVGWVGYLTFFDTLPPDIDPPATTVVRSDGSAVDHSRSMEAPKDNK